MKPVVAIVGRPNVGKSTLFNRIAGRRQAIVNNTAGVTRDRQYANFIWDGIEMVFVDTGGLISGPDKTIQEFIKKQTLTAIEEAHIIICVLDGKEGPIPSDKHIIELLRKSEKPVLFAINKVDADIGIKRGQDRSKTLQLDPSHFYRLGISSKNEFFPVSAEHGRGVDELLDAVKKIIVDLKIEDATPPLAANNDIQKIAVIGRPNAGKSTLINRLFGSERVIAHDMPGTTRDSIDVEIEVKGKKYIFIDTAGLRKKGKTVETLDKYSAVKTLASIESATIVLLMVDANEGFTHQDSFLLDYAYSAGKAVVVLFNKWDDLKTDEKELEKFYKEKLLRLHNVPLLFISARTGFNLKNLFPQINKVAKAMQLKLSTSELNKLLKDVQASHSIPSFKGHSVKFYYATQVNINPPAFIIFTNYPDGVGTSYRRYIINQLQDLIGTPVPVKIVFKKK